MVETASVSIPKTYLFRIDSAKDNDGFFEAMRPFITSVYAGVEFRVGSASWIPDLVKVTVGDPPDHCSLTLIELESTEPVALESCRKYLPEKSADIAAAFNAYLDRVIRQCQSTADPRESEFAHLRALLSDANYLMITTAGALRSSASFVEELPLIDQDQPMQVAPSREVNQENKERKREFRGVLRLHADETKALSRCVMILDAVTRRHDFSKATMHSWRQKAPLRQLLSKNGDRHPALRAFIFETQGRGITLDFEVVLSELVEIWSTAGTTQLNPEHIRALVSDYYPAASAVKGHDLMAAVFETARSFLEH